MFDQIIRSCRQVESIFKKINKKKVLITLYFKNLNQSRGFKFPFSKYIRTDLNIGITVKRTMKLIEKQLDDMAGQTSYAPCYLRLITVKSSS